MASALKTLLWACLVAKSAVSPVALPEISDQGFVDECVREHNRARSSVAPAAVDMLYMTWDQDLALTARDWARTCLFQHNPDLSLVASRHPNFSSVGENIWAGTAPLALFRAADPIQKWVEEKGDYEYESNGCTSVCGHYKQVVWAQTNKVGCAAHFCPNGVQDTTFADQQGVIFVCNYAPGASAGQPYTSKGCSGCEDAGTRYRSDGNIQGTSLQNYNKFNYGLIIIIRSLGLVATLATAYGIHTYYPNAFCYE